MSAPDADPVPAGALLIAGFEGTEPTAEILRLIRDHHLGGVILYRKNCVDARQVLALTNRLQEAAREAGHEQPLLVAIDQEQGRVVRIREGVTVFPPMGAIARAVGLGRSTLYHYFGGDGDRLTSRFADGYHQALLAFIDEAESADTKMFGQMKSLITEETRQVEAKFGAHRSVDNYIHLVFAGNEFAGKISPGSRRDWVYECDPEAMNIVRDPIKRAQLARACGDRPWFDPLGMLQYIYWLRRPEVQLSMFDFHTLPPLTKSKERKMRKKIHAVHRWWHDTLISQIPPSDKAPVIGDDRPPPDTTWTGQSTWGVFWTAFRRYERQKDFTHDEFQILMRSVAVIREQELRAGDPVIPEKDRPIYFGCLPACVAQYAVFLKEGCVSAVTTKNEFGLYENPGWPARLLESYYSQQRRGELDRSAGAFHGRCELCRRCSGCWQGIEEQGGASVASSSS